MKNFKIFVGLLFIVLIILFFIVPFSSSYWAKIGLALIVIALIWKVAKWF